MQNKKILFVCIIFILHSTYSFSQEKKKHSKKVKITPIPYLNYSSTLGLFYGLGAVASYKTNKNDTISPASITGASYIRTTNKSWYTIAFAQLFFNEDKWRVVSAVGTGVFNFQTYLDLPFTEPTFFNYGSTTTMATVQVFRKIYKRNYIGAGYFYNNIETKFNELPVDSITKNNSLQLIYLNDSRNSVYYPTKGHKIRAKLSSYPKFIGNSKSFTILQVLYNAYFGRKRNVLATRVYGKLGLKKNLDFQRQVLINGIDLRGYTSGKYRGDGMFDLQAEYRYNFKKEQFGIVAFGGLGTLYGSNIEDFNWKLYPSIGTGFRYVAIKKLKARIGFDVAYGKEDFAFYFRLGETF